MQVTAPKDIVEVRDIVLPQGGVLTVEMTQAFIDRARQHFGLFNDQRLEDDHVRMFVWGSFNEAVTKAEQEATGDEAGQQGNAAGVRRARRRGEKGARGRRL